MPNVRKIGELVGLEPFYPDKPRIDFADLKGEQVILKAGRVEPDFHTAFGRKDTALLLIERESGEELTTICSAPAVVSETQKVIRKRAFPVYILPAMRQPRDGGNPYWTLNGEAEYAAGSAN